MATQSTKRAKGLSKSKLLAHRQCPKRLWLQTFRPEIASEDASTAAVLAAGTELGAVARTLFPAGVLIDPESLHQAIEETRALLDIRPRPPLFEATFAHDGVVVRADVLLPADGGFQLIEVKSSTSVKDYHLTDVAIQSWVVQSSGVDLHRVEIAHVDTSFVYPGGGAYQGLLKHVDVTVDAKALQEHVSKWITDARHTLAGAEPEIRVGDQCHDPFKCPFLQHCSDQQQIDSPSYPVEDLPGSAKLVASLRAAGYAALQEVPLERLTKPLHRRIQRAVISGSAEIDPAAGRTIANQPYPRYYLDFETLQSVVPVWPGTRPYATQVPFQWSCHIEYSDNRLEHREFLATTIEDPRRDFTTELLACLADGGPIFVYNAAFEKTRLHELAALLPELSDQIGAVTGRIVDLLPLARAYYYHPDMHGSWSIKAVLPTIAPELDYSMLSVADGGMVQVAFRELLTLAADDQRRDRLRSELLEYCGRDTLALVRLAHFFIEHA